MNRPPPRRTDTLEQVKAALMTQMSRLRVEWISYTNTTQMTARRHLGYIEALAKRVTEIEQHLGL